MARFRLLAGAHQAPDTSKPVLGADRKPIPGRFEMQNLTATAQNKPVVESDKDLVALFGPQRFELVGGQTEKDAAEIRKLREQIAALEAKQAIAEGGLPRTPGAPTPENLVQNPATAPGGQVSTGFQGGAPEDVKKAVAAGQQQQMQHQQPATGVNRDADLHGKSAEELKTIAKARGMDLRKLHGKSAPEMVQAIKEHRDEEEG